MASPMENLKQAMDHVEQFDLVLVDKPMPTFEEKVDGSIEFSGMPLRSIQGKFPKDGLKHMVDFVDSWEGAMDFAEIEPLLQQRRYKELPEPLRPREDPEVGFKMQLLCFV